MLTQLRRLAIATALIWIGVGAKRARGGRRHHPDHSGRAHARRIVPIRLRHGRNHDCDLDEHRGLQLLCEHSGGWRTYNGSVVSWDAIGSTPSVNAIDNIGQQAIAGVFLANGVEVTTTTTTTGLWSGNLLAPINQDLTGIQFTSFVWTGTTSAGIGQTNASLGSLPIASQGESSESSALWINGAIETTNNPAPLYAISQVLVVPQSAVPEPSTLVLASMSLTAGLAITWSRSRRAQRRQRPVGRPDCARVSSTRIPMLARTISYPGT